MSSKGGREIEAARKRLAAAKKQATSAANTLESATQTEDSAKKTADTAKQMADTAQKNADTAKRDAAMAKKNAENAKRDADMAKTNAETAKGDADMAKTNADAAKSNAGKVTENKKAAHSQYDDSKKEVIDAEKFLKEAEGRWEVVDIISDNELEENDSRKKQKMSVPDTVLVQGCGISEANGTYKLSARLYEGVRWYRKRGKWKGRNGYYAIFYETHVNTRWCILFNHYFLYIGPKNGDTTSEGRPPLDGWRRAYRGIDPAPTLKFM